MRDWARNLYDETARMLEVNGKGPADCRWVGSVDGSMAISWAAFEVIAKRTNYDAGFGGQVISPRLVVVGDDWWMERHEYDGSEWWEFKTLPVRAADARPFDSVAIDDNYNDPLDG